MHEMGIALQIIDIALSSIPPELTGASVQRIHLKVGRLAAVVPASLRFCFEIAARDTGVAGAELVIEEVPVTARCNDCGHGWSIDGAAFTCPACKSGSIIMISGRELDIESIEVKEEDDQNGDF